MNTMNDFLVWAALDWYGLDGDHISDPARSILLTAIAKAERS
jgi:hypothetical protein